MGSIGAAGVGVGAAAAAAGDAAAFTVASNRWRYRRYWEPSAYLRVYFPRCQLSTTASTNPVGRSTDTARPALAQDVGPSWPSAGGACGKAEAQIMRGVEPEFGMLFHAGWRFNTL